MNWQELRLKEGRGFVSQRVLPVLLFRNRMIYGTCFCIDYGKFKKALLPQEVFVNTEAEAADELEKEG